MNQTILLPLLEAKYHGHNFELVQLYQLARSDTDIARGWLIHAIACNCLAEELAAVLQLAYLHQLSELSDLIMIWPVCISIANNSASTQFKKAIGHLPNEQIATDTYEQLGTLWLSLLAERPMHSVLEHPDVKQHRLVLENCLYERVIHRVETLMTSASVYAPNQRRRIEDSIRNNEQYIVQLPVSCIDFACLQRAMCQHNLKLLAYAEPLVVYRYLPGQEYKWHLDFITPSNPTNQQELIDFGQRVQTHIAYLSSEFTGGETAFKDWQLSLSAKAGDMISFSNLTIAGDLNVHSIHAGRPVKSGVKWVCTLWMRDKLQWLRSPLST